MAKKLYEEVSIKAIADAIRAKNGGTVTYKVSEMAAAVSELGAGLDTIAHAEIPAYVKNEVLAVADKVKAVQTDGSIIFAAITDLHHAGEQVDGWATNINAGNLHACMALKSFAYVLPQIDFCCMLGDIVFGNAATTPALLKSQIAEINSWLDEAFSGVPQFRTVGNHDTGEYSTLVGAQYLYSVIGKYCEGAIYGDTGYGYCYRDFTAKKLRVICLNTCEGETTEGESANYICSPAQRLWFAQTLYDVGSKSDAGEWSILVLGHYPLDYGGTYPMANIVRAYVEGTITTENDTEINFSGHNAAKFVANVHGHTHCFRADKLHSVTNGVGSAFDAKRVAMPNACFYRNNSSASASFWGVTYGDEQSYEKTANTANDTALTINVINPSEQVMYSFCYGAGIDRTISYGATVYHSVTNTLTHATNSNAAVSAENGTAYTASISAQSGYVLETVVVTMGGVDITASAYDVSTGTINIASVTGDIVITATASKIVTYTNLVDTAVDSSGASAPYADGKYLGSSGSPSDMQGFTTTGFIPFDGNAVHVYRIGGDGIAWNAYGARVAWYTSDFALKGNVMAYDKVGSSIYYPTKVDDANAAAAFSTDANVAPPNGAAYFRVSAKGNGANLIITLDEQID